MHSYLKLKSYGFLMYLLGLSVIMRSLLTEAFVFSVSSVVTVVDDVVIVGFSFFSFDFFCDVVSGEKLSLDRKKII